MKISKNRTGFTLIEIITAISVFVIAMLIVTGVFKSVIDGQRGAIASQNTQESMRFALEVMSKEIRMAKEFDDPVYNCDDYFLIFADKKFYNIDSSGANDILYFRNRNNECVKYYVDSAGRLKILRHSDTGDIDEFLTPDEVRIKNLTMLTDDSLSGPAKDRQARITLAFEVEAVAKEMHKNAMTIQTTISSRNYNE